MILLKYKQINFCVIKIKRTVTDFYDYLLCIIKYLLCIEINAISLGEY